jgi:hypothetical protein
MIFVSSGTLSYYSQLLHYDNYPELVYPIEIVNIAKWIHIPYRLIKAMMPAGFADRFRLHDGNFLETLASEIPREHIPHTLGGLNRASLLQSMTEKNVSIGCKIQRSSSIFCLEALLFVYSIHPNLMGDKKTNAIDMFLFPDSRLILLVFPVNFVHFCPTASSLPILAAQTSTHSGPPRAHPHSPTQEQTFSHPNHQRAGHSAPNFELVFPH